MLDGEELKLFWNNVIVQSFIDLSNKGRTNEDRKNKKEAKKWMDIDNKEFLLVCDYAERNPQELIDVKNKILKENYNLKIKRG